MGSECACMGQADGQCNRARTEAHACIVCMLWWTQASTGTFCCGTAGCAVLGGVMEQIYLET
eukprot:132656-Prorocentrum_lima.AAC.1